MAPSGTPGSARIEVVTVLDAATAEHARAVLDAALPPEQRDDRFDRWPAPGGPGDTPPRFLAALATLDGQPVGFAGGGGDGDGPRQLDVLVAAGPVPAPDRAGDLCEAMLDALVDHLLSGGDTGELEVWAKPALPWHERVAAERGMRPHRALHQMRCSLPVDAEPVATRSYGPDDFDALRSVNNRAFASHPDQGGQSAAAFAAPMGEPWFRPEGVRLHERDGRLVGFCWTKIHPSPPAVTELGEIYVIGIDPDFHGQGLGVPMTAAGLAWLAAQGIQTGMLYVEADNTPAIRTYERLGFTVLRTDRAWRWDPAQPADRSP